MSATPPTKAGFQVVTLAYRYIRFSTPKQERGASKARQLDECDAFIKRQGWTPAGDPYEDLGRSAWSGNHLTKGDLGRWSEDVFSGKIPPGSILVVERLDRLSRQGPDECHEWMRSMFKRGIKIAAAASNKVFGEPNDLLGTIEIFLKAKLAQEESDQKSERVKDAWQRKQKAALTTGVPISNRLPGWIIKGEDENGEPELQLHPQRHGTVELIYQMSADGHGHRAIAKHLNANIDLHPTWGHFFTDAKNTGWESTTVGQILKAPAVEGIYLPGRINPETKRSVKTGEVRHGYYPVAVEADLVARARHQVQARVSTGGRYRAQCSNLFTGLVICGACGSKMLMRVTKRPKGPSDRNFHCGNSHRGRGCKRTEFFKYAPFERAALDAILHLALDDRFFQQGGDETYQLANTVAELRRKAELKKVERTKLSRAMGLVDDPTDLANLVNDVTRELRSLEQALQKAEQGLSAARGAVDPAEHLRRVHEVRGGLEDEDEQVRLAARLKVSQAIAGLGMEVVCSISGEDRGFIVHLVNGALTIYLDNHGNELGRTDTVARRRFMAETAGASGYDDVSPDGKLAQQLAFRAASARAGREADPSPADREAASVYLRRREAEPIT